MALPSVLRERDFALLAGSIATTAVGDFVGLVALLVHVEDMTGSGLAVSALLICLWGPVVALAGHVGVLVDRFETTRLLAVVAAAQAALAAALAFADSLPLVLVLTALLGTGVAVSQAGEFSLVPVVARRERLQEANGVVETARSLGFVVGPICGGALAAAGGVRVALLVDAATFVLVGAAALALRARRPPHRSGAAATARAWEGVATLLVDRRLALAMGVAFVSLLFMSASIPADLFFVEDDLGITGIGYGAVLTTWAAGMVLGALVVARHVPGRALATAAFAAVAVQGLGKAVAPIWLVFGFMLGCYLVGGVAHGLKNVMFRTLIHEGVPAELHGRAFAAYNGVRNAAELAALACGGALVAGVGARATLALAGGMAMLAGLAGLALLPRVASGEAGEGAVAATETAAGGRPGG